MALVRVPIEPKVAQDLPRFIDSLRMLARRDSTITVRSAISPAAFEAESEASPSVADSRGVCVRAQCSVDATGQHVVAAFRLDRLSKLTSGFGVAF